MDKSKRLFTIIPCHCKDTKKTAKKQVEYLLKKKTIIFVKKKVKTCIV